MSLLAIISASIASVQYFWPKPQSASISLATPADPSSVLEGFRDDYSFRRGFTASGLDFSGKRLHINSFAQANMPQASFRGAKLLGSLQFQNRMPLADFSNASLTGVVFQDTTLPKSAFTGAELRYVAFAKGSLADVDFTGAIFSDSHIFLTNLKGARFDDKTQLPFSRDEAVRRGMIHVE